MIPFNCMVCGAHQVHVPPASIAETWTGPDGQQATVMAGWCETCGSRNLIDPTPAAVELVKVRLDAMRAEAAKRAAVPDG